MKKALILFSAVVLISIIGCGGGTNDETITIWHQMLPEGRAVLDSLCQQWSKQTGVTVNILYKETEELRSAYQTATLAGGGPELIYGPSDQVGPFAVMGLIKPLDDRIPDSIKNGLDKMGLVTFEGKILQIADRIGNHLCLVYNKDLIENPPENTDEMIEIGKNFTLDTDGDGNHDQYGLVWNFTEPYFFIPWFGGYGGWVFDDAGNPTLNTDATISALSFLVYLRDTAKIVPPECDYNIADALFKEGRAAMIINGPWSWGSYKKTGLNFAVARIPKISSTDKWPTPMVSPKGYSVNVNISPGKIGNVTDLLIFLVSEESQLKFTEALGTIPSNLEARANPLVVEDPLIASSKLQIEVGRPMPVRPELRAIWDAMRPPYQAVLGGSMSPEEAAEEMQKLAEQKIAEMNE